MHIKRMHEMIEKLTECTLSAIENDKSKIGVYPVSDVIDMIKDLSEAEYHAKISHAMDEEAEEDRKREEYELMRMKEEYGEEDGKRYYNDRRYANGRYAPKGRGTRMSYTVPIHYLMSPKSDYMSPEEYERDMDRWDHKMYYTEPHKSDKSMGMMDGREGTSWRSRRSYMETKSAHSDASPESKQIKMRELEKYMNELSSDISEMIAGSSNEEKTLLKNRLQGLQQKIV